MPASYLVASGVQVIPISRAVVVISTGEVSEVCSTPGRDTQAQVGTPDLYRPSFQHHSYACMVACVCSALASHRRAAAAQPSLRWSKERFPLPLAAFASPSSC